MTRKNENRDAWLKDFALGLKDEFNLTENDALSRANSLMNRISQVRPAAEYYWPSTNKNQRNQSILNELKGGNMVQVCKKFRVSKSTVYSIQSKAIQARQVRRFIAGEIPALPPKNKK